MATVAPMSTCDKLTFTQALAQAETQALTTLDPALHERLSCAVALVKGGKVLQGDDGHTWHVESRSTPGHQHGINGSCPCEDAHYQAPQGLCAHRLAVYLARRTLELMAVPPAPILPPEVLDAGGWPPEEPLADAPDEATTALVPVPAAPLTTTADLAASLDAWTEQRALITRFICDHFTEGVDFYTLDIRGTTTKPSLSKVGAEKFLGLFHLQAVFHKDDETWEMLGRPAGVLCYRCVLLTRGGEVVGEGRGCRDVKKDGGDANKAIKMSEKSSLIDAILRTGALSEVYSQDLEDMQQDERQQKQRIVALLTLLGHGRMDKAGYEALVRQYTGMTLIPSAYGQIIGKLEAYIRTRLQASARGAA